MSHSITRNVLSITPRAAFATDENPSERVPLPLFGPVLGTILGLYVNSRPGSDVYPCDTSNHGATVCINADQDTYSFGIDELIEFLVKHYNLHSPQPHDHRTLTSALLTIPVFELQTTDSPIGYAEALTALEEYTIDDCIYLSDLVYLLGTVEKGGNVASVTDVNVTYGSKLNMDTIYSSVSAVSATYASHQDSVREHDFAEIAVVLVSTGKLNAMAALIKERIDTYIADIVNPESAEYVRVSLLALMEADVAE